MKKRKGLLAVITVWQCSVIGMCILLYLSLSGYADISRQIKAFEMSEADFDISLAEALKIHEQYIEALAEISDTADKSIDAKAPDEEAQSNKENMNSDDGQADKSKNDAEKQGEDGDKATPAPEKENNTDIEDKEADLLVAGDLLLSGAILRQYERSNREITGLVQDKLLEVMQQADIFMVNHEFPFSERGEAMENKEYTFRAAPDNVGILKEMGIDIVSLANNHALDYGIDALLDTFDTLDEAGIPYVGAGNNLERAKQLEIIEVNGIKFGFLAASRVIPVTNWNATDSRAGMLTTYDPTALTEEIRKADPECDVLVVYVHWGLEYRELPEEYQTIMAKQYIDAGADVVIGSHPHVVQGFSYYKGRLIAYSLGNFVFGNTIKRGMLLNITADKEGNIKAGIVPFESPGFTLTAMSEQSEKEFYEYLTGISFGAGVDENGMLYEISGDYTEAQ